MRRRCGMSGRLGDNAPVPTQAEQQPLGAKVGVRLVNRALGVVGHDLWNSAQAARMPLRRD